MDDAVDEPLDPTHQRGQALVERRLLCRLRGCPIDLRGKGGRRQRERITDDPCQPLVEIVLVGSLLKGLVLGAARPPEQPCAAAGIAGEIRVEPLLVSLDLLGALTIRRRHQPRRNIAFGKVLQLHGLAAQPDIDRQHDLLDRAEPVCLVRQVDQLGVA